MDLASKTLIINKFKELRRTFNKSTIEGQNIRKGISECIELIIDSYSRQFLTLRNMGENDLKDLSTSINNRLFDLKNEKAISLYEIEGVSGRRYTKNQDKAKSILKADFAELINEIEELDLCSTNSEIKINTISVKESNLKDYLIE